MRKVWIGIDNGISGSIGIIDNDNNAIQIKTPIKKEQDYTKSKTRIISRIDFVALYTFMKQFATGDDIESVIVRLERPMVNPKFFQTSMNAMRSMEATIIMLEFLKLSYDYIDSKTWQKVLLPPKTKDTKLASNTVGKRLFPTANIHNHEDFDGILIAEYMKRVLK